MRILYPIICTLIRLLNDAKSNNRKNNQFKIEIANHGWQHEDFSRLSLQEQSQLMRKSNEKIHRMLGISPSTFIAPFNKINNYTYQAAAENGMNIVSSDPQRDPPTIYRIAPDSKGMYHLPYTAITAHVDENQISWDPISLDKIERAISHSIKIYRYAVIEMHPQEFVINDNITGNYMVNENHLHDIEKLIQWLHLQNIKIITMGEFATVHKVPEFDSSISSSLVMAVSIVATIISYMLIARHTKRPFLFYR